jgi:hypothetical protein
MARIYCCGGLTKDLSSEKVNALILYVSAGIRVDLGAIVEVRSGPTNARCKRNLCSRTEA